jgi:hypothetical protein
MIGWWSDETLEKCINKEEEPARDMREGHTPEAVNRVKEPVRDMRYGHPMLESVPNQLAR